MYDIYISSSASDCYNYDKVDDSNCVDTRTSIVKVLL